MRKMTPTETVVSYVLFLVAIAAVTMLAAYYPDSNSYLYVSAVIVVSLLVAAFFMAKKRAT